MLGVLIEQTGEQGSVLANSLKTIMTRITKAGKASGEFSENISKAEGALRAVGVEVRKDAKNFRDMTDILYDLSKVWNNLDSVTQSNVSFELAGTRQTNVLRTLLNNMDEYYNMLGKVDEAEGITERNQEIFADSVQGHLNDLTNSLEALYTTMANSDDIKIAIDGLTAFVDLITLLVDNVGILTIALGELGFALGGLPFGAILGGLAFLDRWINGDSIGKITDEMRKSKSEFEEANAEIDTTKARLDDINSKIKSINDNNVELTSDEDLKRLETEREELEKQLVILKEKANIKAKEAEDNAVKGLDKKETTKLNLYYDKNGEVQYAEDEVNLYTELDRAISDCNGKLEKQKQLEKDLEDVVSKKRNLAEAHIVDPSLDLDKEYDNINAQIDDYKKNIVPNAKAYIGEVHDKIKELGTGISGVTEEGKKHQTQISECDKAYFDFCNSTSETSSVLGEINNRIDDATDATQKFAKATKDDAIKAVDGLNDGFIALQKIYQDVSEGKGINLKDLTSNDMEGAFGGLESWREFRETIAEFPNDLGKCQSAFNKLASEYIAQSDVLDTLNDDTVTLIENLFKEQGVVIENIDELRAYSLAKQQANLNNLNTVESVKQLENLCNALGITGQMLKDVKELEFLLDWDKTGVATKRIEELQKKLSNPNAYTQFSFNKITKNKSSSGSSSKKDEWLEDYKKQLEILKDKRDMSQISEAEFYEKSNALYEKYLKGRSQYTKESAEAEKNLHNDWNKVYSEERKVIDELYQDGRISASDYYNALAGLASKYYSAKRGAETYGEYLDELREKQREIAEGMKGMYTTAINGAIKILSDEISDLQDAQKKATKDYKDKQEEIDKEVKAYEKEKKAIDKQIKVIDNQKDAIKENIDAIKEQKEAVNDQINLLRDQKDVISEQIDAISDQKEVISDQIEVINEQKEAINEQIDAITKQSKAREREISLEKEQQNLNKSTNQKNVMSWDAENKQWTYKANETDIKNARQKVDDIKQQIEVANLEEQIDKLDEQIKALNKENKVFDERTKVLNKQNKALDNQIKAFEKQNKSFDEQTKVLDKQIDVLEKQSKSLDKEKEAIDDVINKLKEQKDEYADLITQTEKYYSSMIENLQDYMKQWQRLADYADKQKAIEYLGTLGVAEKDILSGTHLAFDNIRDSYMALLDGIKNGNEEYIYQLKQLNTVDTRDAVNNINNLNTSVNNMLSNVDPSMKAYVKVWEDSGKTLDVVYQTTWLDGFDNFSDSLSSKMDDIIGSANDMVSNVVSACAQAKSALDNLSGMKSKVPSVSSLLGGKSFANGTNGKLNASSYNTLVGEMGAELIVDTKHGGYNIVNKPSIVDLPEGSIVFNNEQTMEILRNKKVIARGNALANGTWQNNNLSFDASSLVSGLSLQGIGNSSTSNSTNVSIGDIILHGVQNVDDLSVAIEKRLPNLLTQKLNRM